MLDTITVIVFLVAFALSIIFAKAILSDTNDDIQADDDMGTEAKEIMSTQNTNFGDLMDGGFMVVFVLLWCLVLVASYRIDAHPIFFIFTVILLIFVFFIATVLENTYAEVVEDENVATFAASFPMMGFVLEHLLVVSICVGFSIVLVLFGKARWGQ